MIFVLDLHCCPGHFFLRQRFLHVLWRFPGHLPYRRTFSSRFHPQNQDVSLPPHHFLPEKWRFSGHILPSKGLSPGKVAFFRTYPPLEGTFSRKCGVFQDISSPRRDFLPEMWRFSGHILPSKELSPGKVAFFGTYPPLERTFSRT